MPSPSPATPTGPSVRLYYFEGYDLGEDRVIRSTRPATREFIERFHFQAVEENSVEVDPSQLDAFGLLAGDS